MNTANVRALLRVLAVLMILGGVVGASLAAIGAWGTTRFMHSADVGAFTHLSVSDLSGSAIVGWLSIAVWGLVLNALSPVLARHVTSEPRASTTARELPHHTEIAHS